MVKILSVIKDITHSVVTDDNEWPDRIRLRNGSWFMLCGTTYEVDPNDEELEAAFQEYCKHNPEM